MTVEELRKDDEYLLSIFEDVAKTQIPPQVAYTWFQKRLAAARAEGAEQEREKIRRMQLCGYRVQVSQFPDDERRHCRVETEVYGVAYTLVPASALSPAPKEDK